MDESPTPSLASRTPPILPWETPDLYPLRPLEFNFGYFANGRGRPCSQEDLVKLFNDVKHAGAPLVWTPNDPHLVLPLEVPFLLEANKIRRQSRLKAALKSARNTLVLWGGLGAYLVWQLPSTTTPILMLLILLIVAYAIIPGARALWGLIKVSQLTFENLQEDARYIRYSTWSHRRQTPATKLLCACLIFGFGVQWYVGSEVALPAAWLDKSKVWNGAWWRLITGTLLHANVIHIGFNGMFLLQVGREMEALTHRLLLPIVFLFSAVCGSIASLFLLPDMPSVGASGGLLGLIGFLTMLGVKKRKAFPSAFQVGNIATLVFISVIGIAAWSMIDNAGHLGGALGGACMGLVFINSDQSKLPVPLSAAGKGVGIISALLIAGFTLFTAWQMLQGGGVL